MRRDFAACADHRTLLNFDKRPYFRLAANRTAIEVYQIRVEDFYLFA
jgi:hypothetical protein